MYNLITSNKPIIVDQKPYTMLLVSFSPGSLGGLMVRPVSDIALYDYSFLWFQLSQSPINVKSQGKVIGFKILQVTLVAKDKPAILIIFETEYGRPPKYTCIYNEVFSVGLMNTYCSRFAFIRDVRNLPISGFNHENGLASGYFSSSRNGYSHAKFKEQLPYSTSRQN
jgi:hypothetical protein